MLSNTTLKDEKPTDPLYYVSLKVRNGAGELSEPVVSTPIVVVPNDVTGID